MNILHTSDWHLGQNFMFRERKKEHEHFLDWLLATIETRAIDLLIVAGDIFDTATPPNYALSMYYRFLSRAAGTCCSKIIIIGGNHDSVACLNAPREILAAMDVHVVGGITDEIGDEIITVRDGAGRPSAIVCAVPFLRDRDIRRSLPGESYEEKNKALALGIKAHYEAVAEKALEGCSRSVPVIATGHLFASGGEVREGEYIRDIHVGSLDKFNVSQIPAAFDYVALGHLHRAQTAGGLDHVRYSGSPIPLSFSEAGSKKQVLSITLAPGSAGIDIQPVEVPEFQRLRVVKGDLDDVLGALETLKAEEGDPGAVFPTVWVEISVENETWQPDTEERINLGVEGSHLEIFAVKRLRKQAGLYEDDMDSTTELAHFTPEEVFEKRLEAEGAMEPGVKDEMTLAFREITAMIDEEDLELT
ncbi:MAG: exonuclease subunit SbcD [Desulfobacteraceae bacterium]|nr:exonuclease subunit SbcD [Desulfobacteraceae bacterium]